MEGIKFLFSFIIIITAAVNPKCLHEQLAVEIMELSKPVHCLAPSQEQTILVFFGFQFMNVTACEEMTFLCTSNQPLTWSYEGIGMPEISRVQLIRDLDDCYTAVISVRVGPIVSTGKNSVGLYICATLNAQKNIHKAVHIFKAVTDPIALVQPSGINRNISYDGRNDVVIPCLANWPVVHPKLLKETVYGLVQMNNTWYYPRTGFSLQFAYNSWSDALGTYICEIGPEENTSKAVFSVYYDRHLDKPIQSEQIVINITRGETCSRFTCESRFKLEYELAFFPCQNIKHCEYKIRYAELAVQFPEESKSSDICDELDPLPGSLIRDKTQTGIVICREKGVNDYNFAHHYQLVRALPIPKSIKPEEKLVDGMYASVLDKIYFVNETYQVATCYVSEFLFPEQPRWRATVGGQLNGSLLISWAGSERSRDQDVTILKQKINIISEGIQKLICAAPRWDSQKWVQLTLPLEIKRGTPPKLVNSSAETVYVIGTDKVDSIFVQYSAGQPIPNITWKRNGEITTTEIICCNDNQGEAQINLTGKPKEEAAGLYECEVSNVAGSFTKTINVLMAPPPRVEPTHGMSPVITALIAISASAFILLSLVILGKKLGILKTNWLQERLSWIPFRTVSASITDSPSECNGAITRIPSSSSVVHPNTPPSVMHVDIIEDPPEIPEAVPAGPKEVEAIINRSYMCSVVETEDLSNMKLLKRGNFGIVYIIRKNGLDYALKRMRNDGNIFSTQFLREIQTLEFLGRHENILGFHGVVKQKGLLGDLFIVTDFCRLGDIGTFLETRKSYFKSTIEGDQVLNPQTVEQQNGYASSDAIFAFTTIDLIHWAVDCAAGMEFLAGLGYAHGDLAPRNLLLAADGKVKICDFGLSRPLSNENGTPFYLLSNKSSAVPWDHYNLEFFDTGKITTLTDIWAFGVTVWEFFELGKKPFAGEFDKYDEAYVEALRNGRRLPKPEYASTRIYEIMSSCWNPYSRDRPTFQELGELFQAQLPPQLGDSQASRGDYIKIDFLPYTDENSLVEVSENEDFLVDAMIEMSNSDCIGEDSMNSAIKLPTNTNAAADTGGNLSKDQMPLAVEYASSSSQINFQNL